MSNRSDELVRRISWQLRVEIESDHVLDARKERQISNFFSEAVAFFEQQLIEIENFPALALPSHPNAFSRVECPRAMEMEKCAFPFVRVLVIQRANQVRAQARQTIMI